MKKSIKWKSILALSLSATFVLAGCGNNSNNENSVSNTTETTPSSNTATNGEAVDTSKEEVELKMYLLGEKPKDFDLVYGEVNKLLKQDINATVSVTFLSWADWAQKYPLLFASGDDFDLIYTSNWAQYNTQASKGGFLEVTKEMVDKYMPLTAANMYPEAWEQAKINGKVYMLPSNYKEIQGAFTLLRGDLLDKYGLTLDDVTKDSKSMRKYLEAFSKDTKTPAIMGGGTTWWGMPTYIPSEMMKNWFEVGGTGNYHVYYDDTADSIKAFPFIDTDAFVEGVKVTKEWVDKGIISKSAMVNKSSDGNEFLNGKAPNVGGNLLTTNSKYIAVKEQHPDWNVVAVDSNYGNPVDLKSFTQNGMAINRNAKNPERAMMFLDLLRNDERYFNLTTYGIEGKHYKLSDDGLNIVPLAENGNFAPDSASPWGWRNDKLYKLIGGGIPNYEELRGNMLETAVTPKLQSFVFDDSNVKNELATINNVLEQYEKPMVYGVIKSSVEEDVQSLRNRLKEAGADKVLAEIQKQVDAYLAANK
ncbi:extracellular solute-binding protein [Paenibacillus aurantiacus]|uniref:Extracellular solute-binding protein n=1 Tax=Paenibacillus aurantiacus TaxID=1936118 RepID=A0ABV5KUG0_9BACL